MAFTEIMESLYFVIEGAFAALSAIQGMKTVDLAEDYYELYEQQKQFYYDTFQTGVEEPLANEIYYVAPYALNYQARVDSLYDPATGVLSNYDPRTWRDRHGKTYNTHFLGGWDQAMEAEFALIKTDWANYMMRFEEQYYDVTNDRRWADRFKLHNIGIKQGTAVTAGLDASLGEYIENIQDFSNQLATYGNGIAKYVGYKRSLADPADNFERMEYRPYSPSIPDYNYVIPGQLA